VRDQTAPPETGAPSSFPGGVPPPSTWATVLPVKPPAEPASRPPSRKGMVEYLLVVAFVALAVAGAIALFGDEIRAALGPPPARPAP